MFEDITTMSRTGHLQKGHAVAFADLDNDGDQDIYSEMGGAYLGDAYENVFFLNRQKGTDGHWITISLRGSASNRLGIGSRIKIVITENGVRREIHRDVNSGGSFGNAPLRKEIGLGSATEIDALEIRWNGSGKVQRFKSIKANQFIRVNEDSETVEILPFKRIDWMLSDPLCLDQ
jgi:hypothetical protein